MTLSQAEAFAITLAVEALAGAVAAAAFGAARPRVALAAAEASAATHPFVWAGVNASYDSLGGFTIPLFEVLAIGAETSFFRVLATQRWRDALVLSVVVNATSWGLGALLAAFG